MYDYLLTELQSVYKNRLNENYTFSRLFQRYCLITTAHIFIPADDKKPKQKKGLPTGSPEITYSKIIRDSFDP